MKINIVFLGTSQAVPTAKRNHTGVLVSCENEHMLFDCGEGIQRQLRKAGSHQSKITRIFISHWHGDHILGLPGLLQSIALNDIKKTLHIYGPRGTREYMQEMLRLFVFQSGENLNLKIEDIEMPHNSNENLKEILNTKKFKVIASAMSHGAPCLAYSIVEKDELMINKSKLKKLKLTREQLPLLQKIKKGEDITINKKKIKASSIATLKKGKKLTIIPDTKFNKNAVEIALNSDILISESTYGKEEEDLAEKYNHLTSEQAAKIAKSSKSKQLILTHISQRYENKEDILLKQAKKVFKKTIIAEDLMKLEL